MEFIFSLIIFSLAFVGLAAGVILYQRRIKGSCGGLGALFGKDCDKCDCQKADEKEK